MEEENFAAEPQESSGFAEESRVKSQEPDGFAEESRVKGQEPSEATQLETHRDDACSPEEDTIYEIPEDVADGGEATQLGTHRDDACYPAEAGNTESVSEAEVRIRKMVSEMGAETLLDIIRDNRNAAIRQILSEVEGQRGIMHTGPSGGCGCSSIFDLAAMA